MSVGLKSSAQSKSLNPRELVRKTLHQLRYELREKISHHPDLYLPLAGSSRIVRVAKRAVVVDESTDITIEAFPGSANTYAISAFLAAQPDPDTLKIAHHLHAAAQIIASVRLETPTLVIVREPAEAALSFVVRNKLLSLPQVLRAYCRFHERIFPHRDRYIVATFDQVTREFPKVIGRINAMYGTAFEGDVDPGTGRAYSNVKEWHAHMHKEKEGHKVWETDVPLPSDERTRRKAALRQGLSQPRAAAALERADDVYRRFVALSCAVAAKRSPAR